MPSLIPVPSLVIDVIASLLLGPMVFFAVVVAPIAFRVLDSENADAFLHDLFPRYYLWGMILALAGFGYCLIHSPKGAVLMGLILSGFVYARQFLASAIHEAKRQWRETGSPGDKARFSKLHRRSVIINVAQMGMLVLVILG